MYITETGIADARDDRRAIMIDAYMKQVGRGNRRGQLLHSDTDSMLTFMVFVAVWVSCCSMMVVGTKTKGTVRKRKASADTQCPWIRGYVLAEVALPMSL